MSKVDPLEVLDWTALAGMIAAGGLLAYRIWTWSSFTDSVGPFLASVLLVGGCYWLSSQVEERRQRRKLHADTAKFGAPSASIDETDDDQDDWQVA